jgi:hypothetical protein
MAERHRPVARPAEDDTIEKAREALSLRTYQLRARTIDPITTEDGVALHRRIQAAGADDLRALAHELNWPPAIDLLAGKGTP